MQLLSYVDGGRSVVGFIRADGLIAPVAEADTAGLSAIRRLLARGKPAIAEARRQAEARFAARRDLRTLDEVTLAPLIPDPEKILCVGFNYTDHVGEMAVDLPPAPNIFAKFGNALRASGSDICLPAASAQIDYEGELAVVIGCRCKGVATADALGVVAGYTVFNDVSARDLQFRTTQFTLGKSLDGFAPIGPVMTLAEDVPEPGALRITTRLNGEVMQDESAAAMVYSVPRIIEAISAVMTLEPGDVIATGTPAGVGWKRTPPRFLAAGDLIEVEVSGVGVLRNRMVAATAG